MTDSSTARRIDHRLKKQGWTPESLSCHTGPDMKLSPCPENGLYKRKHNVTYYLKKNFHITTSGMFDTPGFRHALSVMGPERVMFSIDTAYEDISEGAGWFNSLSETVALPQKDWENIAFRNAAKLFDLSVCGLWYRRFTESLAMRISHCDWLDTSAQLPGTTTHQQRVMRRNDKGSKTAGKATNDLW